MATKDTGGGQAQARKSEQTEEVTGTQETTDALLQLVGVVRTPGGETPPQLTLASIDGVIAKKSIRPLVPRSEATSGGLHVRGYVGVEPETHSMHLIEMSVTALPDLVRYWAAPTGSPANTSQH